MDGVAIAQNIMSTSLHQEIHRITDTEEHAREFLFQSHQRGILKATMSCPGCSSPMTLVACSSSKSSDLLIWRPCPPCKRFKNIRSDHTITLEGNSTDPPLRGPPSPRIGGSAERGFAEMSGFLESAAFLL